MKKTSKRRKVIPFRSKAVTEVRGPAIGRVVRGSPEGFTVDFPGNPHGPLRARSLVSTPELTAACDAHAHPEVMLVFEGERSDSPVILGLLAPPPASAVETKKQDEQVANAVGTGERREALIDGRRITFDAKDEIILRCGQALIELHRDGRVVLRGTYIETDSDGLNRIKGSMVLVN